MKEFLTKKLWTKRFVEDKMFACIKPGSKNPADRDWMTATYVSRDIENGVELGLHSSRTLFRAISPFTVSLFDESLSQFYKVRCDHTITFKIEIKTEGGYVRAGEFYYRSDGNPFKPNMEGLKTSKDLFRYLDQPFIIVVKTSFSYFPVHHYQLFPESYPPKETIPHICACEDCEKRWKCPCCLKVLCKEL